MAVKVEIEALKPIRRTPAGETLLVSLRDAKVLVALKRAKYPDRKPKAEAPVPPVSAPAAPTPPLPPVPSGDNQPEVTTERKTTGTKAKTGRAAAAQ